ncbi:hypothetical protein MXB_2684 [Myxobolus squamalis]|nr:hypothetical protein MXB_2684 [Myxobolus squamalis]
MNHKKILFLIYLILISLIAKCFESSKSRSKRFQMGRMVHFYNNLTEHVFDSYAISTDSPRCSQIGKEILDQGGNAYDSAISALFCLSVVHPHSSGIGGGGFMISYNYHKREAEFVNFRETAPSCSNENMANNIHQRISKGLFLKIFLGGLSVAVPGELKGYEYIWKKYSSGITIDESLSISIEKWKETIFQEKTLRNLFTKNGKILKRGEKYYNEKLVDTLEKIATYGPQIFYENFSAILQEEIRHESGYLVVSSFSRKAILYEIWRPNFFTDPGSD